MRTNQSIHEAYAESQKKPLKLFVWEDVIPDCTDGCFVVLAASVEEDESNYELASSRTVEKSVRGGDRHCLGTQVCH